MLMAGASTCLGSTIGTDSTNPQKSIPMQAWAQKRPLNNSPSEYQRYGSSASAEPTYIEPLSDMKE